MINAGPNLNDTIASVASAIRSQHDWQVQAMDVMNALSTKQDNVEILSVVPQFTGKDKNVRIKDWIRAIEKANILTELSEKRIALQ